MTQPLVPPRDRPFDIRDYDPGYTGTLPKAEGRRRRKDLRAELNNLQDTLYADRRYALLVVLQGIDTAGKDGTIKSVFRDVGPLGCAVANFGVPSEEEKAHDFLWRYHRRTPERGKIGIFNRSYYESVLVERVLELAPEERWRGRFEEINDFESRLADERTIVMKFFLHISKEEQRDRLQERVDNPRKRWKFNAGDLDQRKLWDSYQAAFQDMVERCNTIVAPWHVVPADHKWYRDVVIAEALVERLRRLDLTYPDPSGGELHVIVE